MRARLSSERALIVIAAAGLGIGALSFAPIWIEHLRRVLGEGYRGIPTTVSAWSSAGIPIIAVGVILAVAVALVALAGLLRPALRGRWAVAATLGAGPALVLALLLAGTWPVEQVGYASRVLLTPGWGLLLGIGLASVMVVAGLVAFSPGRRLLVVACVAALVLLTGGIGTRTLVLNAVEGSGRRHSDGSYTRAATNGQGTETIAFSGESYRIEGRWSGRTETHGLLVILVDDPACPGARGAYHILRAAGQDIRFELVVDPCADGARAEDLTTGTWVRQP